MPTFYVGVERKSVDLLVYEIEADSLKEAAGTAGIRSLSRNGREVYFDEDARREIDVRSVLAKTGGDGEREPRDVFNHANRIDL